MKLPKFFNLSPPKAEGEAAELRIDGVIVEDDDKWLYDWFDIAATAPNALRPQLKALGNAPLTVYIDSPGGYVTAGAAIYTALKEYPGEVTVKIEARAYSAASVIAMAGDRVLISPVAQMMVHLPWTEAAGNEHELRNAAEMLAETKETLINAYQLKTGKTREEILALLEANDHQGTWMSAKRAVELGFADEMLYAFDAPEAQAALTNLARRAYALERPPIARMPDAEPDAEAWASEADAELALEELRI